MSVKYKTEVVKLRGYKIEATQRIKNGAMEGGYTYAIKKGIHIINTGSISFAGFVDGIPKEELKKTLETYLERYED